MTYLNTLSVSFGTTYFHVAVCIEKKVYIVENELGERQTLAYISFTDDEEPLIGKPARIQLFTNQPNTIYDIHQLIGRKFSDLNFQESMKNWPFKIVSDDSDKPLIEVKWKGETKNFKRRYMCNNCSSTMFHR